MSQHPLERTVAELLKALASQQVELDELKASHNELITVVATLQRDSPTVEDLGNRILTLRKKLDLIDDRVDKLEEVREKPNPLPDSELAAKVASLESSLDKLRGKVKDNFEICEPVCKGCYYPYSRCQCDSD